MLSMSDASPDVIHPGSSQYKEIQAFYMFLGIIEGLSPSLIQPVAVVSNFIDSMENTKIAEGHFFPNPEYGVDFEADNTAVVIVESVVNALEKIGKFLDERGDKRLKADFIKYSAKVMEYIQILINIEDRKLKEARENIGSLNASFTIIKARMNYRTPGGWREKLPEGEA